MGLAAGPRGALAGREAPGGIRGNMPDAVPMAILGRRLAFSQTGQGGASVSPFASWRCLSTQDLGAG